VDVDQAVRVLGMGETEKLESVVGQIDQRPPQFSGCTTSTLASVLAAQGGLQQRSNRAIHSSRQGPRLLAPEQDLHGGMARPNVRTPRETKRMGFPEYERCGIRSRR
jgi:hypothetical protein